MKILYYSAAVRLENEITCIIGMQVFTTKKEIEFEKMECVYKFMIARYFGHARVTAFGEIDKESFIFKTNLTITTDY